MKLFTLVLVALMISGIAMAAEVPTDAGDKAMIFMFQGLDDLHFGGYTDYGFGMRYYIADNTALRGGIIFGMDSWNDEIFDEEGSVKSYGIEAVYEKHLEGPCASVAPYWGLGGHFMSMTDEYTDAIDDEYITSGSGFGVFGTLGFEWGWTDCITLGGEYRLGFDSMSMEFEYNGDSTDVGDMSSSGFGAASVYMSVYW